MMKKASSILAVMLLALPLGVRATDTTDYTTWVQLVKSDTDSNPTDKKDISHSGESFWSNNMSPRTTYNYYVPTGLVYKSTNKGTGPFTFGGNKLAIAGTMEMCTGSGKHINYRELRLLPGSTVRWKSTGTVGTDQGVVVAMGTEESPTVVYADYDYASGSPVYCNISNLTSAADGVLKFVNGNAKNDHWWAFYGSLANYQGTMILADPLAYYRTANFKEFAGTLVYASKPRPSLPEGFPGKVAAAEGYALEVDYVATNKNPLAFIAGANGTLKFSSARTIKSLTTSADSTVAFNYSKGSVKTLTVEESLNLSAGGTIALDGLAITDCTGTPKVVKLMTLAAGVSVPDVSGLKLKPVTGVIPRGIFSVTEGENGVHELSVTWKALITLDDVSDSAKKDFFTYEGNGDRWSSGKIPEKGNDYLIFAKGGFSWAKPTKIFDFLGDSLTLYNQTIYLSTGNINAESLTVDGFSFTSFGNDRQWKGGLIVGPGGMSGTFYQGNTFFIRSTVSGTGDFKFACRTVSTTAEPYGKVELSGTNTAFGGSIWVNTPFSPASGTKPATPDVDNGYLMSLYVTDGRNLGGPWQGDGDWNYQAIRVDNFGRLIARNSVTFNEPTRGFFIEVCTRMEAPANCTMAIYNPVTYAGELRWEGEGTLALGGPVRFMDGEATTLPEAGSNVLHIVKGDLKPLSIDSFNGLQIQLDAAAKLKIDLNPDDSQLRQYGLYNLAEDAFVLPEDNKLKVELVGQRASGSATIGLFTISKTFETESGFTVDSVVLSSALKFTQVSVVRSEDTENGTVTYSAVYETKPTKVLFQ